MVNALIVSGSVETLCKLQHQAAALTGDKQFCIPEHADPAASLFCLLSPTKSFSFKLLNVKPHSMFYFALPHTNVSVCLREAEAEIEWHRDRKMQKPWN